MTLSLGSADAEEVDYAVNTIRSGMDYFFSCEQYSRIAAEQPSIQNQWAMHLKFATLRKEYLQVFGEMRIDELSFRDRLSALLRLVELQLQFMAANFHQAYSNRSLK
jgi:hypothetical protein